VVVKTFGAWGQEAAELIEAIGRRMFVAIQESRSTFFLRQRVDIAIQRGNALSVLGTFTPEATDTGLFKE